ncbi:hypothetical protein [Butyrivibrio sp. VCB2006]|uniref:hypothetical protein n=1 Tax=Butyrivibrio sp. VCB2006 TaxID=1280679 RepID=UPI000421C71D|nr:hypothetical protein [Butyrivibrio sp. VCB2006]
MITIGDIDFTVYKETNVGLSGSIKKGCLHLESYVYGEDYDSEKYYDFSEEDTERLFSINSFDVFLINLRQGRLRWMESFLEDYDIHPKTSCF